MHVRVHFYQIVAPNSPTHNVLADALLDYANSQVVTNKLDESGLDALIRAAGNPPEAGTLKRRILEIGGDDWGGIELHDGAMRNIITAPALG